MRDSFSLLLIFLFFSSLINDTIQNSSCKLIKINYSDSNYSPNLIYSTKDTLTPSGWKIEYFVCDTNPYEDIYIVWSKSDFKDTTRLKGILTLFDYEYIPCYYFENNDYLFFSYDCAQLECHAIDLLRKNRTLKNKNFSGVVSDNDTAYIIYTNHTYSFPTKEYFSFDLKKNRSYNAFFKRSVIYDSSYLDKDELTIIGIKSGGEKKLKSRIKLK